ncbi:MAG: peptide ABC transporter substrate-binding protein [Eubacterium sp.]|nr:peptide ABC transporter substrate-binding protein [Eubacterium sp.]
MRRIISMVLCAAMLMVSGCGAEIGEASNSFSMTISGSPATMDPQLAMDTLSTRSVCLYVSTLYAYNKKNEILPALAESYELSEDKLTYTFRLRDGLKWSDGRPLTAADFVFAFRRAVDPDTGSSMVFLMTDSCTIKNAAGINMGECKTEELGVSAPDDKTFIVELEQPCPYFLSLLTQPLFSPCNEDFYEECAGEYATSVDTILSCGAYMVDQYEPLAVQIGYKKNPYYFDPSDKLPVEINLRVVGNNQQGVMCFLTGMFDNTVINGNVVSWLGENDNMIDIEYANSQYIIFGNLDKSAVKNKHIRRALSLDVDREGIVKNVIRAGAVSLNRISPKNYYMETDGTDFSADDHRYDDDANYSPELAKKEWEQGLKELGTDKVELELALDSTKKDICEIIKQEWEKTLPGLKIKYNVMQSKDWVLATSKAEHDMLFAGWAADYVDPTAFFNMFKTGSHGEGGYSNPTVDELLEKCNTSEMVSNPDERNKTLHRIEDILMEDAVEVPVYSDEVCYLVTPEYAGFDLTPTSSGIVIESLERRD